MFLFFGSASVATSNLQPSKAVLGAKLLKQFNAGSFYGVIVHPSIFYFFGAIWMEVELAAMGQVCFEKEKLSTAIRANKWSFTLTQQADLNLPVITTSSVIMVDDKSYTPTMATSTYKNSPFCVLYDDVDVKWMLLVEAIKAVRFHTLTGLLLFPTSSVRFLQKLKNPDSENPHLHGFELHRPSSKGTKV